MTLVFVTALLSRARATYVRIALLSLHAWEREEERE
jgi:hypothetical protein